MQQAPDPHPSRLVGQLSPKAFLGPLGRAEEPGETAQPQGEDRSTFSGTSRQGTRGYRRKEVRQVFHVNGRGGHPAADELVPNTQEHALAVDLAIDVLLDLAELLHALDLDPTPPLDRDVEVLAHRTDPAAGASRRPDERADLFRDGPGFRSLLDLRARRDLDERDPETVETVGDLPGPVLDLPGGVLLEADREDRVAFPPELEVAVRGDERGALEAGGVRAVDHDLAHHDRSRPRDALRGGG